MSRNIIKRIEKIEQKSDLPDKTIVLRMWCPGGKTVHPNSGRIRIIPLNPEDAEQ